jgi:putative FmdB family regulatory protein
VPLYEYQCPNDGRFEVIRKFSDPPLTACPTCGAEIQKLASAPAIQFKGTGWYVTDYAKKSGGSDGATSSSESGGKEGSKDSGSKDSGSKDSAAKDSGSKDSGAKDSGAKSSSSKDSSSTSSKTTATTGSGSTK